MSLHVAGRDIPADPRLVWQVLHAEAGRLTRSLWLWFGFLGVLVLFGAVGAARSLFPGDKGLGTTPTAEWGLLIVGYVFFAITTSGLCLASSLGTVLGIDRFRPLEKRHAILAVLCLVTAFGLIALDLHYPVRLLFGAAFNPSPSSPMWWMGVFYGIYLCFLLTEVWSMFTDHPRIHQWACGLAAVMAIVAPSTLGAVFGVLAARPFWFGAFTPLLMVASALLSGTALLGVVFFFVCRFRLAGFERAAALAIPSIRFLLTISLLLVSGLVARQVIAGALGEEPGLSEATNALLAGPLALQFWGARVIAGLLLPFLVLMSPWGRTSAGVFAAAILSLIGTFADRLTFVGAGQIAPTTAVSGTVSAPYAAYAPSMVEISILVGAVGLVAFVYTLAERYVDLRESDLHLGLSLPRIWAGWRARLVGGPGSAEAPSAVPGAAALGPVAVALGSAAVGLELAAQALEPARPTPELAVALEAGDPGPEAGAVDLGPGDVRIEQGDIDIEPGDPTREVAAVVIAPAPAAIEAVDIALAPTADVETAQAAGGAAPAEIEPAPAEVEAAPAEVDPAPAKIEPGPAGIEPAGRADPGGPTPEPEAPEAVTREPAIARGEP